MIHSKQHNEIIDQLAREMNLDRKRVAHTINTVFSQKGIQFYIGNNNKIRIDGVGTFRPGGLHWRKLKREKFSRQVLLRAKERKRNNNNKIIKIIKSLSETEKQNLTTYFLNN